jgi:hypothetical protein
MAELTPEQGKKFAELLRTLAKANEGALKELSHRVNIPPDELWRRLRGPDLNPEWAKTNPGLREQFKKLLPEYIRAQVPPKPKLGVDPRLKDLVDGLDSKARKLGYESYSDMHNKGKDIAVKVSTVTWRTLWIPAAWFALVGIGVSALLYYEELRAEHPEYPPLGRAH